MPRVVLVFVLFAPFCGYSLELHDHRFQFLARRPSGVPAATVIVVDRLLSRQDP